MARRIVVVGGGYAGLLAAIRLARKTRARDAEIVLVEARPWFVERVRLHQDVAGAEIGRTSLGSRLQGTRVKLRVGWVEALDLESRRVTFASGDDEAFDELVLATGSVSAKSDVPGLSRAWSCATEEEAFALRDRLGELASGRVVIVGGGLTGIELAAELSERRPDLTLALVAANELGSDLSPRAAAAVRDGLTARGVSLFERTRVAACDDDAVVLTSGDALPSDVTVWAGGFEASPLARRSGIAVDEIGRAYVDARLRSTSHDFVRVIGDAARVMTASATGTPEPIRMACATACPQAAFSADDVVRELEGNEPEPFSFGYPGRCISLGRRDGVVQLTDRHDRPTTLWIGGRPAAWIKEAICRLAAGSNVLERRGVSYSWRRAHALPAGARGALTA